MDANPLISEAYVLEQRRLHGQPQGYGGRGAKWADLVAWLRRHYQAEQLLDYGCGQGSLAAALSLRGIACAEYDPAIPGKDQAPEPADLVICTDVLEHIEPERLPAVLADLARLTRRALFVIVNLEPSNKTLSDGRNAHLIIRPATWWGRQLLQASDWFDAENTLREMPIPPRLLTTDKRRKYLLAVLERRAC